MMTDRILCPWCGAEMRACYSRGRALGESKDYYDAYLRCTKCGAQGPFARWNTAAAAALSRAAAIRRYTPPITAENKLVCPINGAPCSECKPGSPCGVEVINDA